MTAPLSLYVERSGAGPPVLLLHGFTGSARSWDALEPALRAEYTVIRPDLPGHGRSDAPAEAERYHLGELADRLAILLDEQQVSKCVVLGYSMGARAALRFALRHPHRLGALILEGASPGIDDLADRVARRNRDSVLADYVVREGVPSFVDRWEQLPMWSTQTGLSPEVRGRQRAIRLSHTAAGLAGTLRGAGPGQDDPLCGRLHEITVPTLLIVGALDTPYVEHARRMAALLPRCEVEIVAAAGHAVHLEQPDAYARAVKGFLRTHSFSER